MKIILTIFISLLSHFNIAQNIEYLGKGNNNQLNDFEIAFLDSIGIEVSDFDFQHSKVVFVTGNRKAPIVNKAEFFEKFITPYLMNKELPKFEIKGLSEPEKKDYGGFDVVFSTFDAISYKELISILNDQKIK